MCGGLYQEHVSGDHEPGTLGSGVGVVLTLAVLAVLVAGGDGVHAVAGGAVGGGAVGLRGGQAVHALDGVRALAAAGRDGVGALQAAVQGRDGEVVLGLGGDGAGVAQDAHHLGERRTRKKTRMFEFRGEKNGGSKH